MKKYTLFFLFLLGFFSTSQISFGATPAYDNSGSKSCGASSSCTQAFTTTGSDILVYVSITTSGSFVGTLNTLTYGGDAMTIVNTNNYAVAGLGKMFSAYIVGAKSGANNIVATFSGSTNIYMTFISYTGAKVYDTASESKNEGSVTVFSPSLTTTKDKCLVIGGTWTSGSDPSASTSTVRRFLWSSYAMGFFDNNSSKTPAGLVTLNATTGVGNVWGTQNISVCESQPIPIPVLTSSDPTFGLTNSDLTLSIVGENFTPNTKSALRLENGFGTIGTTTLQTTVNSSTSITSFVTSTVLTMSQFSLLSLTDVSGNATNTISFQVRDVLSSSSDDMINLTTSTLSEYTEKCETVNGVTGCYRPLDVYNSLLIDFAIVFVIIIIGIVAFKKFSK